MLMENQAYLEREHHSSVFICISGGILQLHNPNMRHNENNEALKIKQPNLNSY